MYIKFVSNWTSQCQKSKGTRWDSWKKNCIKTQTAITKMYNQLVHHIFEMYIKKYVHLPLYAPTIMCTYKYTNQTVHQPRSTPINKCTNQNVHQLILTCSVFITVSLGILCAFRITCVLFVLRISVKVCP